MNEPGRRQISMNGWVFVCICFDGRFENRWMIDHKCNGCNPIRVNGKCKEMNSRSAFAMRKKWMTGFSKFAFEMKKKKKQSEDLEPV